MHDLETYLGLGVDVEHLHHTLGHIDAHRLAEPVTKRLLLLAPLQHKNYRNRSYPRQETSSAGVIQQASAVGNANKLNLPLQLGLDGTKRLFVPGIILGRKFAALVSGATLIP